MGDELSNILMSFCGHRTEISSDKIHITPTERKCSSVQHLTSYSVESDTIIYLFQLGYRPDRGSILVRPYVALYNSV